MKATILKYTELDTIRKSLQTRRIVLVGGCFDVLHFGHITFLEKAKAEADFLIVALESDEFIKKRKEREPVHSQEERAYILAALRVIDIVVLLPYFDDDVGYNTLVKCVSPDVIAVSAGDRHIDKKRIQAESVGAALKEVTPLLSTFSTTHILDYENIYSSGHTRQDSRTDHKTD